RVTARFPYNAPTPQGPWDPGEPPAGAPGPRRAPIGRLRPGRAAGRTRCYRDPGRAPDQPAAPSVPRPGRWSPAPAPRGRGPGCPAGAPAPTRCGPGTARNPAGAGPGALPRASRLPG